MRKLSEIFTEAAELMDLEGYHGCCDNICKIIGLFDDDLKHDALIYFDELFRPESFASATYYFDYPEGLYTSDTDREDPKLIREQRIFALLLAAEIAESEGK